MPVIMPARSTVAGRGSRVADKSDGMADETVWATLEDLHSQRRRPHSLQPGSKSSVARCAKAQRCCKTVTGSSLSEPYAINPQHTLHGESPEVTGEAEASRHRQLPGNYVIQTLPAA